MVLAGDLNVDLDVPSSDITGFLREICDIFGLKNLVKGKTCFKKNGGSSRDVILTNHPMCFQKTGIFETGLSDHHCLDM